MIFYCELGLGDKAMLGEEMEIHPPEIFDHYDSSKYIIAKYPPKYLSRYSPERWVLHEEAFPY